MGNLLTPWWPWSVGTLLPNPSSLSSASVASNYLVPRAFSIITFLLVLSNWLWRTRMGPRSGGPATVACGRWMPGSPGAVAVQSHSPLVADE